jgi:hypothetical protein
MNYPNAWGIVLLENVIIFQGVKKSVPFEEPEVLVLYTQERATERYPNQDDSRTQPHRLYV